MKHLKAFKIFESNSYIYDIKEIFIQLVDDGYDVKVFTPEKTPVSLRDNPKSYLDSIQIVVTAPDSSKGFLPDKFKISDISSELLRLKDYIGDSYKYLIKYETRKWLSEKDFIDDLSKIEYKEVYKVFIYLYNTNDTYHAIWVNNDDPKVWNVLKPDFTTREKAIDYIKGTHISSNHITKSFISDNEYWLKLTHLR